MQEFDPRRPTSRLAPKVCAGLAGVLALTLGWRLTVTESQAAPSTGALSGPALIALQHEAFAEAETPRGFTHPVSVSLRVEPGETIQDALRRAGVGAGDARAASGALDDAVDPAELRAGQVIEAAVARPSGGGGSARLIGLSMRTGPASAISLSRTFDGALRLRQMEEKVHEDLGVAQGQIEGSLYESAARSGADPSMVGQVVKLFSHKLDFSRDIKAGDAFRLVFDRTVTESGRTVETGDLLYAELEANGRHTRFYRFDRGGEPEYFDEDGKNTRGFLLRTPVDGARITSLFGLRRHPVLGYTRAHQGVDFGAGTGTPILAAGDGVVRVAKRWAGYGNWLLIDHGNGWDTGYGHISRYAPGIRPGARVRQGQVVAYVGATGLATGPHLHYEVWLNGQRVNPMGVKVPQGVVLAGADLAAFRVEKARIDAALGEAAPAPSAPPRQYADAGQAGLRGGYSQLLR